MTQIDYEKPADVQMFDVIDILHKTLNILKLFLGLLGENIRPNNRLFLIFYLDSNP